MVETVILSAAAILSWFLWEEHRQLKSSLQQCNTDLDAATAAAAHATATNEALSISGPVLNTCDRIGDCVCDAIQKRARRKN